MTSPSSHRYLARGRGTTPSAGTGGQSTSGTPKVRLLPGHERPGRRFAASSRQPRPGGSAARHATCTVSYAQSQNRGQRQDTTSPREGCCGSPKDNPVHTPRPEPRSNQSCRKCYGRLVVFLVILNRSAQNLVICVESF